MIKRELITIDASGKVGGRVASQVAATLIGKTKVGYQQNVDGGDKVHLLNVGEIKFTGKKIRTSLSPPLFLLPLQLQKTPVP